MSHYVPMYVHVYTCTWFNERRKKEASKQDQTNNKAKQHSTPKAVTLPRKNKLPRVGLELIYYIVRPMLWAGYLSVHL